MKQSNRPAIDKNPGTRVSPDAKKLISTTDIQVKTYPELLAESGVSVGLVNPLPIWPPLKLENGFCVSGMVTPPDADVYTYPESLVDELAEFGYRIDVRYGNRPYGFIDDPLFADNETGFEKLRTDMFDVMESRADYIKHCLAEKKTEFLYGLLKTVDIIQHAFWAHMEHDDPEYGDTILESYRRVDSLVGWIRQEFPKANLLMFSDHGFGPRRNPRSNMLQSVAYGIDSKISVPYWLKERYRSLLKQETTTDLDELDRITGDHDNPAAWMLVGPDVRSTDDVTVPFDDLTPTLLALHDHPVPTSYSGSVVNEALTVEPTSVDIDLTVDRSNHGGVDSSVTERLYNLGYAEMVEESHEEN